VLASDRGGLGEAAANLPGLVPVEPTAAGVVAGARRMLEPEAWRAAVAAAAEPIGAPDDRARWLADHRRVYDSVAEAVA
jgi:hypothetical protein